MLLRNSTTSFDIMISSELEQLSLYTDRRTGHYSPTDAVGTTQTLPDERLL